MNERSQWNCMELHEETHVKSNIHHNSPWIVMTRPPISRWDIAQRIVDVLALRPCTLDRVGRFQLGDVELWSKFFSQFSHCYIIIIDSSSLKGGLENTRPDRLGRSCCFFLFFWVQKAIWAMEEIWNHRTEAPCHPYVALKLQCWLAIRKGEDIMFPIFLYAESGTLVQKIGVPA